MAYSWSVASLLHEPAILSLIELFPELSYSPSSTLEINKQHKYKTTAYSTTALYLPYSLSLCHTEGGKVFMY
jgi:hypothetical protein